MATEYPSPTIHEGDAFTRATSLLRVISAHRLELEVPDEVDLLLADAWSDLSAATTHQAVCTPTDIWDLADGLTRLLQELDQLLSESTTLDEALRARSARAYVRKAVKSL